MGTIHRFPPPAVPAEGGLPAGVTVHNLGDVPERNGARNLIEAAAMCPERDVGIAMLMAILAIKPGDVSKLNLPSRAEWARLPECARLQFIGDWLRAECFELMDMVSVPSISTIGD